MSTVISVIGNNDFCGLICQSSSPYSPLLKDSRVSPVGLWVAVMPSVLRQLPSGPAVVRLWGYELQWCQAHF